MTLAVRTCDSASLAIFRIALGISVFYGFARALLNPELYIYDQFIEPSILFPYPALDWVVLTPGNSYHAVIALGAIASLFFTLGLFYRTSAFFTFLVYTYQFLLDSSRFNNHYYLISLLCFLFIIFPAQQRFSLVNLWKKDRTVDRISSWPIYFLRFQFILLKL